MPKHFDVERFRNLETRSDQYERQLLRLKKSGHDVTCIEKAVSRAVENLRQERGRSFVIYGEPQSGKTEMMICLTAKLIDDGHAFILHLLNDSVDLLDQNLGRFKSSGLAPAATNFSEVLDPAIEIKVSQHIVFCKKNASDLRRLMNKTGKLKNVVVIDDEADYASPNANINKGSRTKINELVNELLGQSGIYIGVTATPARLDLNNTFENDNNLWIDFPPHPKYTGQNDFFPLDKKVKYQLRLLPDQGAGPEFERKALFGFLINVAYLNLYVNVEPQEYSMLVHTSGKKIDHKSDWEIIHDTLQSLVDNSGKDFERYARAIFEMCDDRYSESDPKADPNRILEYILRNVTRKAIIVLNSENWDANSAAATHPTSLFTIVIGGNIVSRGVTFNNLLSMFFTRDVKHRMQQDTYIQRARMFGNRGDYLPYFELSIPQGLYDDWHRCFVLHRLSLEAIRSGRGSLVWMGDTRITPAASSSVDKSNVDLDRMEMSFPMFDYSANIEDVLTGHDNNLAKLHGVSRIIGEAAFPEYLQRYILEVLPHGDDSIEFHRSVSIADRRANVNHEEVSSTKGLFGGTQLRSKGDLAAHHLGVFYNAQGRARLVYRYTGTPSIQFMKNKRNDS